MGMSVFQASAESLGPLKRYDPYSETADALIRVQGNPKLGTPFPVRSRVQRIADGNQWLLETSAGLCMMAADSKSGKMETLEFIDLPDDWCLSPDGHFLFCKRREPNTEKRIGREVYECFNFRDGIPMWELDKGKGIYDSAFSRDGQQLITLQALEDHQSEVSSAVVWYDVKTGRKSRQVNLPGTMKRTSSTTTDCLAESGDLLFVTRPSEHPDKAFSIKTGQDVAEPVELEPDGEDEAPRVRSGGPHGEWVAFYTNQTVRLFEADEGKLMRVHDVSTPPVNMYSYESNVRFSPDGSEMLVSSQGGTLLVSTAKFPDPEFTREAISRQLGDYTADGKFFVFFDEGGGWIHVDVKKMCADR